MKPNIFLFDVESTSLFGWGFAVGAIVMVRETGEIISKFELVATDAYFFVNEWVKLNVLPNLGGMPTCKTRLELREAFYAFYMEWRETSDIWSDCNFPVETNFLAKIVSDDKVTREFTMPYPFYDVANFIPVDVDRAAMSAIGNLIKHRPLHDAIASAHCLFWQLYRIMILADLIPLGENSINNILNKTNDHV